MEGPIDIKDTRHLVSNEQQYARDPTPSYPGVQADQYDMPPPYAARSTGTTLEISITGSPIRQQSVGSHVIAVIPRAELHAIQERRRRRIIIWGTIFTIKFLVFVGVMIYLSSNGTFN